MNNLLNFFYRRYRIEFHHDFEFDYYDIEVYHTENQSCNWKGDKISDNDNLSKQMKTKQFAFDLNYLNCFNNSTLNLTFDVNFTQFFYVFF